MTADNELSWVKPSPFILPVTVSKPDLDSYQHVNNSVYVRWLDDCARAHSLAVGINCEQATEFGLGMAVRESRVTYLASAYEHDELLVGAWVLSNDQKLRLTRCFQIIRRSDQRTLIQAEIDYVCIRIDTGKAAKMPLEFRQGYQVIDA